MAAATQRDAGGCSRPGGCGRWWTGTVAAVLPAYLLARGFSATQVGAIVTATLLGSAAVTLTIGLRGGRFDRVHLLQVDGGADDRAPGWPSAWWPPSRVLLVVAAVGTHQPVVGGDVSAFLPIEQALLPDTVPTERRTHVFARYSLVASLAGAVRRAGRRAARAGSPSAPMLSELEPLQARLLRLRRWPGVVLLARLPPAAPASAGRSSPGCAGSGLGQVARHRAAAVGAVQRRRLRRRLRRCSRSSCSGCRSGTTCPPRQSGAVFFWSGLLTASSALLAPRLAGRIGLIRTMVFTHLPANLLLIAAALMPTVGLAVACLLARVAPVADGRARPHVAT